MNEVFLSLIEPAGDEELVTHAIRDCAPIDTLPSDNGLFVALVAALRDVFALAYTVYTQAL